MNDSKSSTNTVIPVGIKNFGDLHSLSPISQVWGYDRGQPIDRYYIEKFLQQYSTDIKGRVLEIKDSEYTRKFGGDRVTLAEVLDINPDNKYATYCLDLSATNSDFPQDLFDCFIFTQTLLLIYDVQAVIRNAYMALKPGGILLATVSGISRIDQNNIDYWRFTKASIRKLFGDVFGNENIIVGSYGNVLTACGFLYGLASDELTKEELDFNDSKYQININVRAIKV